MILDAEQQFSDAQALTATAASTNYINLSADRDIGRGEPMAVVITVGVALAGTSPTFLPSIETDDNTGFASATTLISGQTYTALAVGDKIVLPVPHTNEQYIQVRYTLGGTTPTVTVDAYLQPLSMVEASDTTYADGYSIT